MHLPQVLFTESVHLFPCAFTKLKNYKQCIWHPLQQKAAFSGSRHNFLSLGGCNTYTTTNILIRDFHLHKKVRKRNNPYVGLAKGKIRTNPFCTFFKRPVLFWKGLLSLTNAYPSFPNINSAYLIKHGQNIFAHKTHGFPFWSGGASGAGRD